MVWKPDKAPDHFCDLLCLHEDTSDDRQAKIKDVQCGQGGADTKTGLQCVSMAVLLL